MNDTTKRDSPFPNSSSTPLVLIQEICDDPNDPNYWKKNITTQEDRGIKIPISQPGISLTEFAERLIALEQENVVLREGIEQLEAEVAKLKSLVMNQDGFVPIIDKSKWTLGSKIEAVEKPKPVEQTEEPKDESSTTISSILRKYNLSTDDTALPDIKIGDFTLERSKLPKFTAEDLKVAKDDFDASNHVYGIAHELESQLIETANAAVREVDTWILDIFKTLYGCKSVDDVYLKITHQQYFNEFKRVIERVNERLEYIDKSQSQCERDGDTITYYPLHGYRLSVPREPVKPSEELYQNLKSLWEEVYNEN